MAVGFLEYIFAMLLAGIGSFGGGLGGVNIMKEYALSWASNYESAGAVTTEILNVAAVSQYGGYAQGMTLAVYLGNKTPLGIFGGILGAVAFILPSVLIVIIFLKIGERLYKSNIFKHSVNYINLLAAGLICMILWNYMIAIFFGIDMLFYPLIAAIACFVHIYFKVNPAIIILAGGLVGLVWRA